MSGQDVCPPPGDGADDRDTDPSFFVALPDRHHDRSAVKQCQAHFIAGEPINGANQSDQEQRFPQEEVLGLSSNQGHNGGSSM